MTRGNCFRTVGFEHLATVAVSQTTAPLPTVSRAFDHLGGPGAWGTSAMAYVPDDPGKPVLADEVILRIVRAALAADPRTAASLRLTCRRLDELCCQVLWERFQTVKRRFLNT